MDDLIDKLREMCRSHAYALRWHTLQQAVGEILDLRQRLAVATEQLAVAAARAQRFRDALLRLAARDYSHADIEAHVADALEVSVAELRTMLEE